MIGVLAGHPRRDGVGARLIELDERNVAEARETARAAGLEAAWADRPAKTTSSGCTTAR